ncbi:hypothetical protein RDABS01_029630 [Bienertia sinuspersici]
MTNNPFSMEALKNTMKIAWRLGREVVVREIEHNLFIFQFFSPMDKAKILEEGPWSFNGPPPLLKEVDHEIQPSEIVFDMIRFWVKVEDMQLNKRTRAMAISLAASMGEFVDFDDSDPIGWSKYMRFRVDIKRDKPLKHFTRIATQGGSKLVKFTHERLMDICHACGRLGHGYQQCEKYDDRMSTSELAYGPWLKASLTKRKGLTDHRREEERKVCQEFKGMLKATKARTRLQFKDQMREVVHPSDVSMNRPNLTMIGHINPDGWGRILRWDQMV